MRTLLFTVAASLLLVGAGAVLYDDHVKGPEEEQMSVFVVVDTDFETRGSIKYGGTRSQAAQRAVPRAKHGEEQGEDPEFEKVSHDTGILKDCESANRLLKHEGRSNPHIDAKCKLAKHYIGAVEKIEGWYNATHKSASLPAVQFYALDRAAHKALLQRVGLEDSTSEVHVLARRTNDYVYVMKEDYDEEAVKEFVTSFAKDKLKRYIRSEKPPKGGDAASKGPLRKVVGKTFEKAVLRSKAPVLVELCILTRKMDPEIDVDGVPAPPGSGCSATKEALTRVAERMAAGEKGAFVALVNHLKNDVPAGFMSAARSVTKPLEWDEEEDGKWDPDSSLPSFMRQGKAKHSSSLPQYALLLYKPGAPQQPADYFRMPMTTGQASVHDFELEALPSELDKFDEAEIERWLVENGVKLGEPSGGAKSEL